MSLQETDRQRWLEMRKNGLGGSDAATIMGVNPWSSPYALFLEKAGLVDTSDQENERMIWGRKLESVIASHYEEVTGRALAPGAEMQPSSERPHLFANTDRMILPYAGQKRNGIYEGKTTSAYNLDDWRDGKIPLYYQVQTQHYFYVLETDWGSVACLVGGQQFVWSDIERNDTFLKAYVRKADEFWDRVLNNDPPPMEGHPAERRALNLLYGEDTGEVIELPEQVQEWADRLAEAKEREKEAKAEAKRYETLVAGVMKDASFGRLPDGTGFKYVTETKKEHVRKAWTGRVLRKVKLV